MDSEDLVKEFETKVIEITNRCLTKLDNSDPNKKVEIFSKFQENLADEARNIIHKAIENNVDDRINIVERLTQLSVNYAEKLKAKVQ